MDHFAGLDVSVKVTSVCIVNDTGRIIREVKVASQPALAGTTLPRFGRLARASAPLLMQIQYRIAFDGSRGRQNQASSRSPHIRHGLQVPKAFCEINTILNNLDRNPAKR